MTTAVQARKRRAPKSVIHTDAMSAAYDADPADVARRASLRYVTDTDEGYSRHRRAAGFTYRDQHNRVIRDRENIERIAKLAIPPAWSHVWIAPQPNGHIQATGRDAKGRKQYRYHARWQTVRGEHKFDRMIQFGVSLSIIRARVMADLERNDLSREHVLAIVVRLLETTYIRIGNEEYARTNHSFGLTTLRNRHVQFSGQTLRFQFIGKMGKAHSVRVNDRRLARLVRRCRELPGQSLFQYHGDDGAARVVDSSDVNDYINAITGESFSAKDFRTWAGSLLAATQLSAQHDTDGAPEARLTLALKAVASQLGNTPAVCRSGYVHPRILQAYHDPSLEQEWNQALSLSRSHRGLTRDENALLSFLQSAG